MKAEIHDCLAITMVNNEVEILLPEFHTKHHFDSILSDLNKIIAAAPAGLNFIIDISRQHENFPELANVLGDMRKRLKRNGCEMQVAGIQTHFDINPTLDSQSSVDQQSADFVKLETGA